MGRKKRKGRIPNKFAGRLPCIRGVLCCVGRGRFGFVTSEDSETDIFVHAANFAGANHGDTVLVQQFVSFRGKNREGAVVKVIARTDALISAVVGAEFDDFIVAGADDARFYPPIRIPKRVSQGATYGDRVMVRLTDYDKRGNPDAEVVKLLGNAQSLKTRIDAAVISHSIKQEFDAETLAAAEKVSAKIPARELEMRLDLRNEMIFTIDGADAKDFDDAVSIKKLPHGRYRLGVHIADVSHYVRPKSRMEAEAYERGTSVYLPDRVIPMLPERISNDICSLKPNCDRLTISCIMTVDSNGEVCDYKIKKSVICSKYRMTYDDVAKILDGDKQLCVKYKELMTPLKNMNALADILITKRRRRGSIDFDLPEVSAELENDYTFAGLNVRRRLKSHRIIEEFMLLANETVARYAVKRGLPLVYRTHAAPDADKIKTFNRFLTTFGLGIPYVLQYNIKPGVFANLLDKVKGRHYEDVLAKNMLRAMMKAEYKTTNDGHFGIASEYYCHFTSPIRRYADLMVHRVLTASAEGHLTPKYKAMCERAAVRATETERRAEECERDIDALLKTVYMRDYLGCEFDAIISGVCERGMYAELDNSIEGMIKIDTIGGDYYTMDKMNVYIRGRRHGKKFYIGDRVRVVVTEADPETSHIDLMLKKDYDKGKKKWENLKL